MAYWILGCLLWCALVVRCGRSQECFNKTVGLRNGSGIPSYYLQASSFSEESFNNRNKLNKGGTAWCPSPGEEKDSYLEVDLGHKYLLCGVSTQGVVKGNVKKYKLLMSSDRINWVTYSEDDKTKNFSGSTGASNIVNHTFTSTQKARFVRFYPINYDKAACMLVKLYGTEFPKEICEKSSLSENNEDLKLETSNSVQLDNIQQLWCLPNNSSNAYLQIDIGSYSVVCAVKTLDNTSSLNEEVKSYHLEFSMDGKNWLALRERNLIKNYVGDKDHILSTRILCQYIRFTAFQNIKCLRVELYGYVHADLTSEDIGLKYDSQSRKFPDQSFTSTKITSVTDREPKDGRLYLPNSSWCSKEKPSYLEIVLVENFYIFAVSVEGFFLSRSSFIFTKKLKLLYSTDYQKWYNTSNEDEWIMINQTKSVSTHLLKTPIESRIFRFEIPYQRQYACLKVELHGISARNTGWCSNQYPLGLSVGTTLNIDVKGSSSQFYPAKAARLRNYEAWDPQTTDKNAYITIKFGELVLFSGVATQGFNDGELSGRMTRYRVRYSYGGQVWYNYTYLNNSDKIFNGNIFNNNDAIFANWFDPPIVAKFIRLVAVENSGVLRLRMELYGCKNDFTSPDVKIKSSEITLNRTVNASVNLMCIVHGQPGMTIKWTRNGDIINSSSLEVNETIYPSHFGIFGIAVSNLTINYNYDQEIYENFKCSNLSKSKPRELYCHANYECSASYPGGKATKKTTTITVAPNMILPASPDHVHVPYVKSRSAFLYWNAAKDYVETRITYYMVHLIKVHGNTTHIKIRSGLVNSTLVIKLSDLSEFTEYSVQVSAVNNLRSSSFTEKVDFTTLLRANVSLNHQGVLKVKENQRNVSIVCTGISYPTPQVTWMKNNQSLASTVNHSTVYQLLKTFAKDNKTNEPIKVTSTLFLRPAGINSELDYGTYTCEVLNRNESNIPVSKMIDVFFPPKITEKPRGGTFNEGSRIIFTCHAKGPPTPNISWHVLNDDVEIIKTDHNNGTLVIDILKSLGKYNVTVICQANSTGGESSATARAEILVKPRITDVTKSTPTLLYHNITLNCTILANPPPRVFWTKDDKTINEKNIHFQDGNKTLLIKKALPENIGKYSCVAKNYLNATSKSVNLRLKAYPKAHIVGDMTRKLRNKQKNVTVTCYGFAYPKPNITWKLNDNAIEKRNSSRSDYVYQQIFSVNATNITGLYYDKNLQYVKSVLSLRPHGANFSDYGEYLCEVDIGTDTSNESVEVIFIPIIEKGPRDIVILTGEDVMFDCVVGGKPVPFTVWLFRNGNISTNHTTFRNGSLKLYTVQNTNAYEGNYSCYAESKAGKSENANASLTVHVPARIVAISESKTHQLKDDVTLTCNASGDPFPLVKWQHFNDTILLKEPKFVFSNNNQYLTIQHITLKEQGTYICTVNNTYAVDQKNVTVNVEVRPKAFVDKSLVLVKNISKKAIIICTAKGYPPPRVRWFRKGKLVEVQNDNSNLSVYQIIGNEQPEKFLGDIVSTLYVNPGNTDKHFGNYTCNATKIKDNEMDLVHVEIVLVPTIKITRYPVKDTVLEGTDVYINCTADGSPTPMVKWIKYVKNSSTEVLGNVTEGNNLLVLRNVTNQDEGTYICSAKNRGKPVLKNVTLTVHVKPRILTRLHNADVQNGTSHQLNCSAYGDPNVMYKWRKDGEQSIPNSEVINQNKSLKVEVVRIENQGMYTCIVENIVGNDSTTANITVFARPEILNSPQSQTFNESQTATFCCMGKGIPVPAIIWRKNGEDISNYTRYNITTRGGMEDRKSTLQIHNLKYKDQGNISCTMENRKDFQTKTAVLIVQVRPNATATMPVTKGKLGSSVNLTCVVYGFPQPMVSWEKNSLKVNQSHQRYRIFTSKTGVDLRSNLEIMNLQRNDNGSYSCFLENKAGTDQTNLSLVVLELPDKLTFSSKNLTSRSIVLEWRVTFDGNSKVRNFILHYSSNTTKDGLLENITDTLLNNVTTYMAKYLKPWRWYTFKLTAINNLGPSKPAFISIRTEEDVPSKPENVLVEALDAFTLRVSWSPPKEENGRITMYVIYYTERNILFNMSTTYLDDRNITGLKPFTNYTIQIEAHTSKGAGNKSSLVVQQTKESTPSKPENLQTVVVSNTSIQLFWSPPEHENGIILQHTIYYKEDDKNKKTLSAPGTSNDKAIKNLRPFTNYTFWVRASTSAGDGDLSEMVRNQTQEGVPSEPRNIKLLSSTSSSVNITWDPPEHLNGILVGYIIHYHQIDLKVEEPTTKWTIKDLDPYAEYNVYVQAYTSAGGGKWSERLPIVTKPKDTPPGVDPTVMIPIVLPHLSSKNGNITFYRIIVVLLHKNEPKEPEKPESYKRLFSYDEIMKLAKTERYGKAYIAFAFKAEDFAKYQRFVLGNGTSFENEFSRRKRDTNKEYKNGKLIPDSEYAYHLRGYTSKDKFVSSEPLRVSTSSVRKQKSDSVDDVVMIVIVVAAVFVLLLFVLLLFITAIWFRINKREKNHYDEQGMTNLGHAIPLPELRSYLESMDFSDEFQAIPKLMACAITEASRPINIPKNRYRNILPYDYTRVILSNKEGEDHSDYINANFIKGLRKPEKYIATQGPLPNTASDFWRMVWEQECSVIVMLTGLEENGKVKCYQYWPATPEGKIYENICVYQTGQAVLADYTVRYFDIKDVSTEECRKVQHLHFTSWPDHGVPNYAGPLLRFHSCFRSALVGSQPAIVHCSAGCGRTGAFIALDYILQKLDEEQNEDPMVDIMHFVREMRGQRFNMVQVQDQYELIHQMVLEATMFARSEIASADVRVKSAMLRETIPGSRKTKAKVEFEKIKQCMPAPPCEYGSSRENLKKNRFQVLPYDFNRVELEEMTDKNDYINASLISGYQLSRNFIATQNPLSNTVEDFWRMIYEQKCGVIVCISSKEEQDEFGLYWPSDKVSTYGPITVTREEVNNDFSASGFVVTKFHLMDARGGKGNKFSVTQFHFFEWPRDDLPQASSLLQLLAEVESAQRFTGNKLITVHCSDGCGRTGTFCAIVMTIERVKLENSLDLVMTVRNLRAQRPEMVQNEMQYLFCYDAVAAFVASFDDQAYANFQSNGTGAADFPSTSVGEKDRVITKC